MVRSQSCDLLQFGGLNGAKRQRYFLNDPFPASFFFNFRLFNTFDTKHILPMSGFELRTTDVGTN